MMIKEIKLQKLAKMYTCWLDSCLVTRKHRNHTQSTTCSNRRGWLKGHFETSILYNGEPQVSLLSKTSKVTNSHVQSNKATECILVGWTAAVNLKSTEILCRVQNVQAEENGSKVTLKPQFSIMASCRQAFY